MTSARRTLALIGAAVVLLALLAWGARWWLVGRFYQFTDDAYVGSDVTVISPRVSGYVARVLVADNAFVHAGQALVELDAADYRARLDGAQAASDAARATLARLAAQRGLVQADISQAEAQAQVNGAAARFAIGEAGRYARLAASQSGTQQDSQRAQTESEQAQARLHAALAAVTAQQRTLAVVDAQLVEARAALGQAEAVARGARLAVGYVTLYAPVDGYVGNRSAHPGTFVAAGTQLLSLVPAGGLWVDANFKEDQISRMRPGQAVELAADVDTGLRLTGHVQSLSPATGAVFSVIPAQNATGNFTRIVQRVPVRITLDPKISSLGALRAGLSVTATVDTRSRGS